VLDLDCSAGLDTQKAKITSDTDLRVRVLMGNNKKPCLLAQAALAEGAAQLLSE